MPELPHREVPDHGVQPEGSNEPFDAGQIAVPAQVRIRIQGVEIANLISKVTLTQSVNNHHQLEIIVVHPADEQMLDPTDFADYLGNSISVNIATIIDGEAGDDTQEFAGIVTGINVDNRVDATNRVHIIAASPTIGMDRAKIRRFWYEQSPSDIIASVLGSHSITVGTTDTMGSQTEFIAQYDETDYEFVKRLASSEGRFSYYDGTEFRVVGPSTGDRVELNLGQNLGSFRFNLGVDNPKYQSNVYDYLEKNTYTQDTNSASPQASLSSIQNKSPQASDNIFSQTSFVEIGQARDNRTVDNILTTKARSSFSRMVTCRCSSSVAAVKVGSCVEINGVEALAGMYFVTKVIHHIDESSSYYNEFWCSPIELVFPEQFYGKPKVTQLQPAVVTDNNDPEQLGRVKVSFPWSSGDDTPWIRVASTHAGQERGWYVIPEIGDEVLIGYEFGNPDLPVVIASMYNSEDTPIGKIDSETNNVKIFTTRSGNEIYMSDADGEETIQISNQDGQNQIVLTLNGPSITIKSDGDITIDGANITIKASDGLTLESGSDTSISAGAGLTAEASASGKLKASGTLDVEGAMVNVKGNPINLN